MIINESAKSLLEIDNIETALIQPERRLWWSLSKSEEMKKNPPYQVIGVIKDFKSAIYRKPLLRSLSFTKIRGAATETG